MSYLTRRRLAYSRRHALASRRRPSIGELEVPVDRAAAAAVEPVQDVAWLEVG